MHGHLCCSHMLINILSSLLPVPWWLEDLHCLFVSVELTTWRRTSVLGRGKGERGTEESLLGPWRAFFVPVKKSSVKTISFWRCAPFCSVCFFPCWPNKRRSFISWCTAGAPHRGSDLDAERRLQGVREQWSNRTQELIICILTWRWCVLSVKSFMLSE